MDADRFWARVEKTDGCWYWLTRSHYGRGPYRRARSYSTFTVDGATWYAHRYACMLTYGPIPDGLVYSTCVAIPHA